MQATTSQTVVVCVGLAQGDIIKADLANQVAQSAPLVTIHGRVTLNVLYVLQDNMVTLLDIAPAADMVLTKTKRENRVVNSASLALPKTVILERRVSHVRQADTKFCLVRGSTMLLPFVNHALQEKNLILRLPSALPVPPASIKINPTCTYIPTIVHNRVRMLQ